MDITPEKLFAQLEETIEGTIMKFEFFNAAAVSCQSNCGYVETPDGRKAQVQLIVTTDQDDWMDDIEESQNRE